MPRIVSLVLCSLLAAPALGAPSLKPLKVPAIQYEKYTLPNGLEVILHEDHRLPLVGVDIWYHVGPVNERAGRTGFAHLFEHMMFQGSGHVGEKAHFKYLEAAGASDINGTTNYDRTNYFETLPSNRLELAMWLESDRMGFLLDTLDRAKLTNQRDVVRNERREGENRPYSVVREELTHQLFPKQHPYYAQVIGSHADIEAARLADVREFSEQCYTPSNATLVIAGDFTPVAAKQLVERYFGPLKHGPPVARSSAETPPITSERRSTVEDTVKLPAVLFGWLSSRAFAPGDAEGNLTSAILGAGNSSRLYQELVYKQQIAQSASCYNRSLALTGVLGCTLIARPGVSAEQLEKAANAVLADYIKTGPTEDEINRARNVQQTQALTLLQHLGGFGGVADTLNYYNQYTGDPGYLAKDLARYNAVTPATMQSFAAQVLIEQHRVTVFGVPGKKKTDDVPRSPDETDATVVIKPEYTPEFTASQSWRASAPKPGPAPTLHLPEPSAFTLANGLKVYLSESHTLPVFTASLVTLAGAEGDSPARPGVAGFTAAMLPQGTANHSATEIANLSDEIGATLVSTATTDSAHVGISALTNATAPAVELLADLIQHPGFTAEETDRLRKARATSLLQDTDQPLRLAALAELRALYGADNPYGYNLLGTESSLAAITPSDLEGFWKAHYGPSDTALILAGDLTTADAHTLAETYFGKWASSATATQPPPAPPAVTRKVILIDQPGAPQTALIATGIGVPRSNPDYMSLQVVNTMLGGLFSSRINMNLREVHGYTYGAGSRFDYRRGAGPFIARSSVRTDVTAPALHELVGELERIRTQPLTADELKRSKDDLMQALPGDFETADDVAAQLGQLFLYNLPLDYYRTYPLSISAVTAEQAAAAADKYIHPEQMVLIGVGDVAKIRPEIEKLNLGPIVEWNPKLEPVANK